MITFSNDPVRAEQEMHAVIFYLVTFGYIDGDFDAAERGLVRETIRKLISHRAEVAMPGAPEAARKDVIEKYTAHFHEVMEGVDQNVKELFTESVSENEDPKAFVHAKLKVKCFEIFGSFDRGGQEQLMSVIDELLLADGVAHPAEVQFRGELAALLESDFGVQLEDDTDTEAARIEVAPETKPRSERDHPFFKPFEFHFSRDKETITRQVAADRALLDRAIELIESNAAKGKGRLKGVHTVAELPPGTSFYDGHVIVRMPKAGEKTELTVLGDLHGCYSILKATLLQSRFFERVDAYRASPDTEPFPMLVLLGDYIDRGLYSLNGVLRTALQIFVTAPEHVVVLRGNHEYFVEVNGTMYGGVKPAESINSLKPHLSVDVFRHYRQLFETLPTSFLFDRMLFVHGGIPKDRLVKERWKDLSTLDDPDVRFQMMWSDPSSADIIPADLQDQAARFAFGKMQFRAFMQRIGSHTLIRGHEKVLSGFEESIRDDHARLFTLFSAGGKHNGDLPDTSTYRDVTPMALTIHHGPDGTKMTPWAPDWESYNDPERNAFFKAPPEIEHRG